MNEVYLTRLFLPRIDNHGVTFPFRLFKQTERTIRLKFGGLTLWGEVEGQWVGPSGHVDLDSHRVYEIAHAGREVEWWENLKVTLKQRFSQEDIWILQSTSGWMVL